MGGNLFDSVGIKREHVDSLTHSFMISTIPNAEYIVTGSYRRGAKVCGDIEIVLPCDSKSEYARVGGCIAKRFGCTKQGTPNTHGMYGQVQFDLFPCHRYQLGSMLLHSTGSWKFNKMMRTKAMERGLLLNQYCIKHRRTDEILLVSPNEEDFFKYLWIDFVDPNERSMV